MVVPHHAYRGVRWIDVVLWCAYSGVTRGVDNCGRHIVV